MLRLGVTVLSSRLLLLLLLLSCLGLGLNLIYSLGLRRLGNVFENLANVLTAVEVAFGPTHYKNKIERRGPRSMRGFWAAFVAFRLNAGAVDRIDKNPAIYRFYEK